jgi:hypothetical protein
MEPAHDCDQDTTTTDDDVGALGGQTWIVKPIGK